MGDFACQDTAAMEDLLQHHVLLGRFTCRQMILNMNGYVRFLNRFIESTKEPLGEPCQFDAETVLIQQSRQLDPLQSLCQYVCDSTVVFCTLYGADQSSCSPGCTIPVSHKRYSPSHGAARCGQVCNRSKHSVHP